MREVLPRESKYFYPLPKQSLQHFFKKVFGPPILGQSLTLQIPPLMGGGKALVDFCWRNRDHLARGTIARRMRDEEVRMVYIDTKENPCENEQDFFNLFYRELLAATGTDNYIEERRIVFEDIINILIQISQKYQLVIILRGINKLSFDNSVFWKKISAFRVNPFINFIFIYYGNDFGNSKNIKYEYIKDLSKMNVYTLERLNQEEVNYSVNRWEKIVGYSYSPSEEEAIINCSKGNCRLVKKACLFLAENSRENPPTDYLIGKFRLSQKYKRDYLNDLSLEMTKIDLTKSFTSIELKLLELLFKNKEEITNREVIVNYLWDAESINTYSDNSINQYIYRIRKKLKSLNINSIQIRSIYGRGYILELTSTNG